MKIFIFFIELDLKTFAKGELFLTIRPLLISSPWGVLVASTCSFILISLSSNK